MSEKYLISIAIGPVQDFIASARRSRDLWFGSHLLSELSKVVAETIENQKGELIFPSNLSGNVVNKILAVIENPKDVETNCKNAIETKLKKIYDPIFKKIEVKLSKNGKIFYRPQAEAQILDMVEFYWAAIPFDESKDDYKVCRERVEILLNARKSTRNFKQISKFDSGKENAWGSNAPKSSLDGGRESVIKDSEIDSPKIQKIFGLRKKERLCGVGLLKRLGAKGTDDSFFSTSHVASLPLISTLKNDEKTNKAVNNYVGKIADSLFEIDKRELYKYIGRVPENLKHDVFHEYDGHLLFDNRLDDLPFESQTKSDEAKKALKQFMEKAFDNENTKPLPYYALLLADGDRMGTVIDNQKNKQDHKDLSEALSDFAANCKPIVEANNGCLIYAGGDDVLAFVPLHTVLDCAKKLADDFKDKLSENPKFVDKNEKPPTLSVGIAVAHHIEPLQDALKTMRQAEKEAKSVKDKNALAIILSKRSGVDTTIRGSWENDRNSGESFDERLKWFIYLHLADALPDGVAYELRDLWLRLFDKFKPNLEKVIKAESLRILERKRIEGGTKKISGQVFEKIEKFFGGMIFPYQGNPTLTWTIEDLANEIIVARDFAKAQKQAGETAQTFARKHNLEVTEK